MNSASVFHTSEIYKKIQHWVVLQQNSLHAEFGKIQNINNTISTQGDYKWCEQSHKFIGKKVIATHKN
jgi:hypothetical protein